MTLHLRFIDGVDERLKPEIVLFASWLRHDYPFPTRLTIRLIDTKFLVDPDGSELSLRWWQSSRGLMAVTGEIAVGEFADHMSNKGPTTAFPSVVDDIGRVVKYYYQAIRNAPLRQDYAASWSDKLLDAYIAERSGPPPWRGADHYICAVCDGKVYCE